MELNNLDLNFLKNPPSERRPEDFSKIIDDLSKTPGSEAGNSPAFRMASALFAEWVDHDFDSAFTWLTQFEPDHIKYRLFTILAKKWPAGNIAENLSRIKKISYPAIQEVKAIEIQSELNNGPEKVGTLLEILDRENLLRKEPPMFDNGVANPLKNIPPDFDFGKLVATQGFQKAADTPEERLLLDAWTRKDYGKSLDWFLANRGARKLYLIITKHPDNAQDHFKWWAEKLSTLPTSDNVTVFFHLMKSHIHIGDRGPWYAMDRISDECQKAGDTLMADKIRGFATEGIFGGATADTLPLFDKMNPSLRKLVLQTSPPFGAMKVTFGSSDEEILRMKQQDWAIEPQQMDLIIQRFRSFKK